VFRTSTLVVSLGILLCGCATRSPAPPAPPAPAPRTVVTSQPVQTVVLSAAHIELIRGYYGNGGHGRGRVGLPPGIAKNLQRGKPLPPGIARQHLPGDLYARLPPPPAGLEYVIVAGKLILVEVATQVVRQILLEAVFG
jgi:hypothetical protein